MKATNLTENEKTQLKNLIPALKMKKKLSENEQLILQLSAMDNLPVSKIANLKLLLKSEKLKADKRLSDKQTAAVVKQEAQDKIKQEQQKYFVVGKVLLDAITNKKMLGKDYPYAKLLKKMVEQDLFSDEEQQLLRDFLVAAEISSEKETDSNSEYLDETANKIAVGNNRQNENSQIEHTDVNQEPSQS